MTQLLVLISLFAFSPGPTLSEIPKPLVGHFDSSQFKYVVVIPDIHGDMDALLGSLYLGYNATEQGVGTTPNLLNYDDFSAAVLRFANIVTDRSEHTVTFPLSSMPGKVLLVQLGDVVDRGDHSVPCLTIMKKVEEITGWKTVRLYGNHELMNYLGVAGEYVNELEVLQMNTGSGFSRYPGMEPGGEIWKTITDSSLLVARLGDPNDNLDDSAADQELRALSSPSTLFVHGGIDGRFTNEFIQNYGHYTEENVNLVDKLNQITRAILTAPLGNITFREHNKWLNNENYSPLWHRSLTEMTTDSIHKHLCEVILPNILKLFKVARIVIGHTPLANHLMFRTCKSRLILADSAISRFVDSTMDDPRRKTSHPAILLMQLSSGELRSMGPLYPDIPYKPFYSKKSLAPTVTSPRKETVSLENSNNLRPSSVVSPLHIKSSSSQDETATQPQKKKRFSGMIQSFMQWWRGLFS